MQTKHANRVLAISLSSKGFGYACLEGKNWLVDYGNTTRHGRFKNAWLLSKAVKLIERNMPDTLVLQNISAKDTSRSKRVKDLLIQLVSVARKRKIKVSRVSVRQVRMQLLSNESATKHELAQCISSLFPAELSLRMPPKRRPYDTEHPRMNIFDAVGLVAANRKIGGSVLV